MVGQHIRAMKGGRWIHAIDCGDETVLHLVDEAPPRVRRAYRPEFVAGSDAVEVITHRERTFPAKEIVRRAYSRASDPALASMFRDSEAFAEWCATGRLLGPRNVALEVPGLVPAVAKPAPAKPAPSKAAPVKAAAARAAPKKAARSRPKPAARKAKLAAKKPAKKASRKAKGTAARKAKAPARRGAAKKKSKR